MPRSKRHFVYRLLRDDGRICYVGCSNDPAYRMREHFREANSIPYRTGTPFYQWLHSYLSSGRKIRMQTIAASEDVTVARAFERYEIDRAYRAGEPLKNWTIKGSGHAIFGFNGRCSRRRPGCSARTREGLAAYFKRIAREERNEAMLSAAAAGGRIPDGERFGASPEAIRRAYRSRKFRAGPSDLAFAGRSER